MIPKDFPDRLERSLAGELPEEELRQLCREMLENPEALDEFLAARTMDHDLKRLLSPGSGDEAFLRGLLNARSSDRKDPEAFVRSVARALSERKPRTTRRARRVVRAGSSSIGRALMAAGLLVGALSLGYWVVASSKSRASRGPGVENVARPGPEPARLPETPEKNVPERTPQKHDPAAPPGPEVPTPRKDPLPAPEPKAPAPEEPAPPPPGPKPAPGRVETPAPRTTVAAFASLGKIKGDVFVFAGSPARKSPASEGQVLSPGQGVLTEGAQSAALLSRHDSVQLALGADTEIRLAEARSEIALFQGRVEVEAGAREPGQDVLITTPHAEVRAAECRFTLASTPASTSVEVRQGTATFRNAGDGKLTELKAGQRAVAQDPPGVDRRRVDEALRRGLGFLRKAPSSGIEVFRIANCDELMLLTLLSAGVPESDPDLRKYLKNVLSARLDHTYLVSLQAMALEELDRVKYQDRIAECAQFLVDNQCANGQWTYFGEPSPVTVTSESKTDVATSGAAAAAKDAGPDLFGRRTKPAVVRKLQIRRTRDGAAQGDNSNSQYAALGLRACFEAGVKVPAETVQRSVAWWRKVQYPEATGRGVASGEGGTARGWCYNDGKNPVNGNPCCVGPYFSMTAGAVSSLIIYDHLLGTEWKKDVTARTGLNWMTNYFLVSQNLGVDAAFKAATGGTIPPETYIFYGLYALERVGVLSEMEKLGRHAWYAEGAKYILGKQKADGSWSEPTQSSDPTWDTCFSILFLKRATRPLADVPSVDRLVPRGPAEK